MKSFSDSFNAGEGTVGGHDKPGPYSEKILTGQDKKEISDGEPKFSNRVETGQKIRGGTSLEN